MRTFNSMVFDKIQCYKKLFNGMSILSATLRLNGSQSHQRNDEVDADLLFSKLGTTSMGLTKTLQQPITLRIECLVYIEFVTCLKFWNQGYLKWK